MGKINPTVLIGNFENDLMLLSEPSWWAFIGGRKGDGLLGPEGYLAILLLLTNTPLHTAWTSELKT